MFKKLFCEHRWQTIEIWQEQDKYRNMRYGMRKIRCVNCGEEKTINSNEWHFGNLNRIFN